MCKLGGSRLFSQAEHVENVTISGWENGHFRPNSQRAVVLCRALPELTLDAIYLHSACVHPQGLCPIHARHGGQRPDSLPRKGLRRA